MDWKVIAALAFLGIAILGGFVICVVTSVNRYAKQLTATPKDMRRGFEVKTIAGEQVPASSEKKDDHHG